MSPGDGAREEFLAVQVGLVFGGGDPWFVWRFEEDDRNLILGAAEAMLKTGSATLLGYRMKEYVDLLGRSGMLKR